MGKTVYEKTSEGGICFKSERRSGEVRVANYVYDLWLPLLGATAIGVYSAYCRLERQGQVRGKSLRDFSVACRIGVSRLDKINTQLKELGFIKTEKPTGWKRLAHWTTTITVLDPPSEVPEDAIKRLAHPQGYEPLAHWLVNQTGMPIDPNGSTKTDPNGLPKIASSILNPLSLHAARAENKNPSPAGEETGEELQQEQEHQAQDQAQQDWEAGFNPPPEPAPSRTAESYRDELVATESRSLARRQEQPWATWGEQSQEARAQLARRDGMAQSLRRLGYELDTTLGLRPLWKQKKSVASWFVGLANCLAEAESDIDLVLEAAKHLREQEMTISSPHSLVKTTGALAAKRRSGNSGTISIGL